MTTIERATALANARKQLQLSSIVLITSITICKHCQSQYRAPSSIFLELTSTKDGSTELCKPQANVFEYSLPRLSRTLTTFVDACEQCFTIRPTDISSSQLSLFESERPASLYALVSMPFSPTVNSPKLKTIERNDSVASELAAIIFAEKQKAEAKRKPGRPPKEQPKIVKTEDFF